MIAGRWSAMVRFSFVVLCALIVFGALDAALAQPFGMTRGSAPSEVGGVAGWVLASSMPPARATAKR